MVLKRSPSSSGNVVKGLTTQIKALETLACYQAFAQEVKHLRIVQMRICKWKCKSLQENKSETSPTVQTCQNQLLQSFRTSDERTEGTHLIKPKSGTFEEQILQQRGFREVTELGQELRLCEFEVCWMTCFNEADEKPL